MTSDATRDFSRSDWIAELAVLRSRIRVGILDSRILTVVVSFAISGFEERVGDVELEEECNFAISSPILDNSFCRLVSASEIALASFCNRSRNFCGL